MSERAEDVKVEDVKVEDVAAEDVKVEDVKVEVVKVEDVKLEDVTAKKDGVTKSHQLPRTVFALSSDDSHNIHVVELGLFLTAIVFVVTFVIWTVECNMRDCSDDMQVGTLVTCGIGLFLLVILCLIYFKPIAGRQRTSLENIAASFSNKEREQEEDEMRLARLERMVLQDSPDGFNSERKAYSHSQYEVEASVHSKFLSARALSALRVQESVFETDGQQSVVIPSKRLEIHVEGPEENKKSSSENNESAEGSEINQEHVRVEIHVEGPQEDNNHAGTHDTTNTHLEEEHL